MVLAHEKPLRSPTGPVVPAWHRLPDESTKTYDRFVSYLAMGAQRSYRAISLHYGVTESAIQRQAKRYKWASRAAAYDQEMINKDLNSLQDIRENIRETLLSKAPDFVETITRCAAGNYHHTRPAIALQAAIKGLELCGFVPPRRSDPRPDNDDQKSARDSVSKLSDSQLAKLIEALSD